MSSFFLVLAKIFCRKEVCIMAVVYATLIVKGKKTLDDVPALLKEQVQDILVDLDVSL
ncbi:CD1375 family protein [Anaerotruncus colihominis]|nr:CD1375 family protein [Anaerotruncus colihominis]MCR2025260.1 CD1375 family protein [Anaerotruncus colihominis]